MKEEKSNIDSFFLKAFLVVLLATSFALVGQHRPASEKYSVISTELNSPHRVNAVAIAASLPEIPSSDFHWTFGSNGQFMVQDHPGLKNFYCEINLAQKQKYFQNLFLGFKETLDNQSFIFSHSQSKEAPVSYSA